MSHGGVRPNSGRKKGSASKSNEEARLRAAATGELPLDYMLKIMRDPEMDHTRRDDMAKASAPFVHSKLSSVDLSASVDATIQIEGGLPSKT